MAISCWTALSQSAAATQRLTFSAAFPEPCPPAIAKLKPNLSAWAALHGRLSVHGGNDPAWRLRQGADLAVDAAIAVNPTLEAFLSQRPNERMGLDQSYLGLAESMGVQVVEDGNAEDAVAANTPVDDAPLGDAAPIAANEANAA